MIQLQFRQTESGHAIVRTVTTEDMNAVDMMRGLKLAYPQLWQQVNLEIVVPQNGQPRGGLALPEGDAKG